MKSLKKAYLVFVYEKLTDKNGEFKYTYDQALLAMCLTEKEIDRVFS